MKLSRHIARAGIEDVPVGLFLFDYFHRKQTGYQFTSTVWNINESIPVPSGRLKDPEIGYVSPEIQDIIATIVTACSNDELSNIVSDFCIIDDTDDDIFKRDPDTEILDIEYDEILGGNSSTSIPPYSI